MRKQHAPVVHGVEALFVTDIVHEDEAHGAAVVRRGDCPVSLLACRVLHENAELIVLHASRAQVKVKTVTERGERERQRGGEREKVCESIRIVDCGLSIL